MTNIIDFSTKTGYVGNGTEIDTKQVINAALELDFESVVVCGQLTNGEIYVAGSHGSESTVFNIELAKRLVLKATMAD